ncbi:hypothetical protein [Robertkochia aurantiaca]|uniref:hypothetical protein n=1 Tax=Robertkochia aurantiaca TaxID=2873700 RepID=UPI001CCA2BC3|nr:hypothetical protein [Robertkochia sp. 3YJGBD-33]
MNQATRKTCLMYLLPILAVLFLYSCNDDDDNAINDGTAAAIADIEATMSSDTWIITEYNDSGVDETDDYNGFVFTFADDGTLTASNGTESYEGTWSVTADDDSDDDNSDGDEEDIDFNIFFSAPEFLAELTDDWDINASTNLTLDLFDVSGGDGTTDRLIFERN